MAFNKLTTEEKHVIEGQGTEKAYSGEYDDFYKQGTYVCRKCNNPLFGSKAKFDAKCGWPAFDEHFDNAVKWIKEDGILSRTEIQCAKCNGHLGHVFQGEKLTDKDTRHCVNSLSIKFIAKEDRLPNVKQKS